MATLNELTEAGQVASASGQAALLLARRLDSQLTETGSSVAAMVREHRAALADALKGAKAEVNPLDELRARRERKLDTG
jgi:anti-sigma-K factor RskA